MFLVLWFVWYFLNLSKVKFKNERISKYNEFSKKYSSTNIRIVWISTPILLVFCHALRVLRICNIYRLEFHPGVTHLQWSHTNKSRHISSRPFRSQILVQTHDNQKHLRNGNRMEYSMPLHNTVGCCLCITLCPCYDRCRKQDIIQLRDKKSPFFNSPVVNNAALSGDGLNICVKIYECR